jgi:hypothetical protein
MPCPLMLVGALNANPHIQTVTIDGVYSLDQDAAVQRFHFQAASTPAAIQSIAQTVRDRVSIIPSVIAPENRGLVEQCNDGL